MRLEVKDNLTLLKSLIYEGVNPQLIYIDPPYNTGKQFKGIYKDLDFYFDDRWYNKNFQKELKLLEVLNTNVKKCIQLLQSIKTKKSLVSYLTHLSIRLCYTHIIK